MKFKTALFYNGAIAYYNVYCISNNGYKIKLDSYSGEQHPPLLIELYRNGRLWNSSCKDQELVKELGAAIEQKTNL